MNQVQRYILAMTLVLCAIVSSSAATETHRTDYGTVPSISDPIVRAAMKLAAVALAGASLYIAFVGRKEKPSKNP